MSELIEPHCPKCHCNWFTTRQHARNGDPHLFECKNCGFIYISPQEPESGATFSHLVAAHHDMLEVLEELCKEISTWNQSQPLVMKLTHVIAKAKGES